MSPVLPSPRHGAPPQPGWCVGVVFKAEDTRADTLTARQYFQEYFTFQIYYGTLSEERLRCIICLPIRNNVYSGGQITNQ